MTNKDMVQQKNDIVNVEKQDRHRVLRPAVDIFETDEGITLMADLPGVTQNDLKVQVEDGMLKLSGESHGLHEGKFHWREFEAASYQRSFRLSDDVNAEAISAELKNGVLTVRLPKAESAKPRKIDINSVH